MAPSHDVRCQRPAKPSSQTQSADPTMLRCPVHATAGTSVRWRAGPAGLTPRPTTYALRREGTHRRKRQSSGPIGCAARAQPLRRATPSTAHGAMPLQPSPCPGQRLHTDSSQTLPPSRHARATSNRFALVPGAVDCARVPIHACQPVSHLRSVPRLSYLRHVTHRTAAARCIRTSSKRACAPHRGDRCIRRDSDGPDECRPYGRSAGRAVSVPLGVGANANDRQGVDPCRFAPPTPP